MQIVQIKDFDYLIGEKMILVTKLNEILLFYLFSWYIKFLLEISIIVILISLASVFSRIHGYLARESREEPAYSRLKRNEKCLDLS